MDLSRISKKTPHEDGRMTLTAIDQKTMENYESYYKSLPEKKKILSQLNRKKAGFRSHYTNEYHELCKKIDKCVNEIKEIENKSHQINYLLKASQHFLEYASGPSLITPTPQPVNSFFVKHDVTNRGKICQEYIKECIGDGYSLNTRSNEIEITGDLTCKTCGVEKLTNPRESYASCPQCGEVTKYQDTQNNKGEYSEEVEVISPFAYKRINHFKEWIGTLIGREGTGPSQEIIDELLREMLKDRVKTREEVTEERIRGYLKKLKHSKLYDHIPAIIFKLSGTPPLPISPKLEAKLIEMFQQCEHLFEKYAPPKRKNFLSYAYTIRKMLQLLDQNHLAEKLHFLKSREKLHQQDLVWRSICAEIGWRYYSSL